IYPYISGAQEVLQHDLFITGQPEVHTYFDYWRNKTGSFSLSPPHQELVIESKLVVRTLLPAALPLEGTAGFDSLQKEVNGNLQMLELAENSRIAAQHEIEIIVEAIYHKGKSVMATVQDCCAYIFQNFNYLKGITDVETTVDEILQHRAGVCQDFAHVMLQV